MGKARVRGGFRRGHDGPSPPKAPSGPPAPGYPVTRARRGSTVIPAKAGIHGCLGTRVRGYDCPTVFPAKAGIHPRAAAPPSGYPRPRARRGSTVSHGKIPTCHRGPKDAVSTPAESPHRSLLCGVLLQEWHAPPPPSGYPRPRARRGSTVIPAKAGIHPWPHLPLLGTRVRGHDVVPPSFLRKQESIPGPAPPPPSGYPRPRKHDGSTAPYPAWQ